MQTAEHEADPVHVRRSIRDRYTHAARKVLRWTSSPLLGPDALGVDDDELLETGPDFGSSRYAAADLVGVPRPAVRASLGCGNPSVGAPIVEGDVVLDVGCGGGIDVILAAAIVGARGRVVGVDLSSAMTELARQNVRAAGVRNANCLVGLSEALPLRAGSIDVVISNAVIHLSVDKPATIAELFRVLVPGGRLHLIDIVADDSLSVHERRQRATSTNTTAGMLSRSEYGAALVGAGFEDVRIRPGHRLADRVTSSLVTATRHLAQEPR